MLHMSLGPKGVALIKGFEKLALSSYLDEGGIPTIGYGHTGWYSAGVPVTLGQTCTVDQALDWFQRDAYGRAVQHVNFYVTREINQNQFDALCSFTYNCGAAALQHSTLLHFVNEGVFAAAALQFERWDHVKGVVSEGLQRRRLAEKELFLSREGV